MGALVTGVQTCALPIFALAVLGEAEGVIEAREKGGDFGKLAAEHSVDNSGKQGGDLGWFARSDMVPAFGKAAFELKVGEYTEKPVESQFGWPVIKVDDPRTQPATPFEKARDDIQRQHSEGAVVGLLTELRTKAKSAKKHGRRTENPTKRSKCT